MNNFCIIKWVIEMKTLNKFLLLWGITIVLFFAGCKDDSSSPEQKNSVGVSFFTDHSYLAKSLADSLVIDSVKVLIKSVKFKPASNNDSVDIKIGPMIVNLSSNNTVNQIAVNSIPAGSYDRVRFRIHKPEGGEVIADPEFNTGTSENERFSVIVKGKFNGTAFVYRSKKSAEQFVSFQLPLTVTETSTENITLVVNPYSWFKKSNALLNPSLAANENDIDNNIKTSFNKAYKDTNKDGKPD